MRKTLRMTMFATAATAVLASAGSAQASVTLGQAYWNSFACGGAGYTLVQDAVASDPTYTVPAGGGVLTSWSSSANGDATTTLRLKVYRRTADPSVFTPTGESAVSPVLAAGNLNTFPTRVPVQADELLGLSVLTGISPACAFNSASVGNRVRQGNGDPMVNSGETLGSPGTNLRVNVSAVLERDADYDGYGDETQDGCPQQTNTQAACNTSFKVAAAPGKKNVGLTVKVPGAGTVSAGDANDRTLLMAVASKRKKRPLFNQVTKTRANFTPGNVQPDRAAQRCRQEPARAERQAEGADQGDLHAQDRRVGLAGYHGQVDEQEEVEKPRPLGRGPPDSRFGTRSGRGCGSVPERELRVLGHHLRGPGRVEDHLRVDLFDPLQLADELAHLL